MGICFFCPNGHPLNVKAELAGKIGLCPKCRVKMRIPLQSMREVNDKEYHGQPTAEAVVDAVTTNSDSQSRLRSVANESNSSVPSQNGAGVEPMNELIRQVTEGSAHHSRDHRHDVSSETPSSEELLSNPDVVWFVITQSGQKYGPAQGTVLQSWIHERRVGPKMLVLRSDWKSPLEAGQVFPEIVRNFENDEPESVNSSFLQDSAGKEFYSGAVYGSSASRSETPDTLSVLKKRQKRAICALYLIGFLTFVLLCAVGVLIFILIKR